MQAAYGRSQSGLDKVHIIDPETYNGTITGGIALCCLSSSVRMIKADKPGWEPSVTCKRCLKIHEKRTNGENNR